MYSLPWLIRANATTHVRQMLEEMGNSPLSVSAKGKNKGRNKVISTTPRQPDEAGRDVGRQSEHAKKKLRVTQML